jgi:hypothetical protein
VASPDFDRKMNRRFKNTLLIIFALALLWSLPSTCVAQQWARSMFSEFSHDFGNVPKGQRPEHRFVVENKFKEDIKIRNVVSSCGCTSVSITKKTLKMWEKAEVVAVFNSQAFDGFKQATVTVQFERPYVGEVQLTVRGNIVRTSGLSMSPKEINFGQVTEANLPERVVRLETQGDPSFRVVDVKSTFPHISVSLKETVRNSQQVGYEMRTQLKPSIPAGAADGELILIVDERNGRRQIRIPFDVKVVAIKISPEVITLANVKPGQEVKKTIILQSERKFNITDVKCRTRAYRVKQKKKGARKVHVVDVIYTGEDEPGKHECDLSFYTDLNAGVSGVVKAIVNIEAN